MADLPSPQPDATGNPSTRELLDELDVLMEKMLALPVQQQEEPTTAEARPSVAAPAPKPSPAASKPSARSINQLQVPATTVTIGGPVAVLPPQQVAAPAAPVLRPPPGKKEPPPQPKRQAEPSSAPTYVPVGAEPLLPMLLDRPKSGGDKKAEPPMPTRQGVEKKSPPAEVAPTRPIWFKTAPTAPPPPSATMQLLLTVNRLFDRGTALFGSAGRWLRSEQGRATLGWSGIAMLAIALIWAAVRFLG